MKHIWSALSWVEKIIFIINGGIGVILLFAYLLPFIPPRYFEYASLSVFTPILMLLNIVFIGIWIARGKWIFLFSGILFCIGLPFIHRFVQLPKNNVTSPEQLSVMSFNVRLFNHYKWSSDTLLREKILTFVKEEHPKSLALQEFYYKEKESFPFYKYKKFIYKYKKDKIGQAILSDYPIINSGSLDFPHTGNNGVYADIVVNGDTLRLYSLHFESFHIEDTDISQENSKRIFLKLPRRFAIQQAQVELFNAHADSCPYPIVVCGDFNNTAFSYLYQKFQDRGLVDSFEEAGSGFGHTYDFPYFPFRIDYILADPYFKITSHKVYTGRDYSDHFPIRATLKKRQ